MLDRGIALLFSPMNFEIGALSYKNMPKDPKECVSLPMYICPWANPIKLHI